MTEQLHPTPTNMETTENEKLSLAEELHHISEQLEELIQLIKGSASRNKESTSDRPSQNDSEVMTVKEAAAFLRISLPMMYEFARTGKVHTVMAGRKILVSRSSLMALLREGD
ncbi:MAG: helix-turn-helix domain-containing protein [Lachnospiraceae bacterium]|nr:helix-turn-helix domain-containing protein [Lachnospiraceae bacterium]